ncbi:MAG TPA: virulence factor SrfC family protein, partial [Telluria sp.]
WALSELDIVKILANSYVEDVAHPADDNPAEQQADVEAAVDRARLSAPGQGTLTVEDMYDLEAYCHQSLSKNARMASLKRAGYWNAASDLVPSMSPEARITFFSTLWEDLGSYTDIFRRLQAQLIRLKHAKVIYCEPCSLFAVAGADWNRQAKSIIDVATLAELGRDTGDVIKVAPRNGVAVSVERAELAALVSELYIPLASQPHPFFASTDLLDFPGARSRQPLPRELIDGSAARSENFLRGKVAYLFERYSAERELSAMLLCVGPSNQEVVGLGELIDRWVELTHGRNAEERRQVPCTLFFVLTKFDTAFAMGPGMSVDGTRWTTRLEASLLKPFGDHSHRTKWVGDWDGRGKFNNTFWLRNPNLRQDALFEYASASSYKEMKVRDDKVSLVGQLRGAFVGNRLVSEHFVDADAAWDSAWVLNDGGMSRIVNGLQIVCRPEVKRQQIQSQITMLVAKVLKLLVRYHVSSDLDTLQEQKKALATDVAKALFSAMKQGKLGAFLSLLKLDDDSARSAYLQTERELASGAKSIAEAPVVIDDFSNEFAEMLGMEPSTEDGLSTGSMRPCERDFASVFASNLVQVWLGTIVEQSKNPITVAYHGVPAGLMIDLARELEVAVQKTGVYQRMVDEVRTNRGFRSPVKSVFMWRQVAPVASRFNRFIDYAGNQLGGEGGVNVRNSVDKPLTIFARTDSDDPMSTLSEVTQNFEQKYYSDWIQGVHWAIRTNAAFLAGVEGDTTSNARLGDILKQLKAVEQS